MIKELKPCPFCGSHDLKIVSEKTDRHEDYSYLYHVECDFCMSKGAKKVEKEWAIEIWNWRAETLKQCPACGIIADSSYCGDDCPECGVKMDKKK